jgi:two-component sensor histidine kinase/streptogramin lyase
MVRTVLQDRQGTLWLGTVGQGLIRIRDSRFEHFSRKDGLSSDDVEALAEDLEGNLWVGTSNGFDRFREPKVARWSTFEGLSGNLITVVCSTRSGDVWVAAVAGGLNRIRGNQIVRYSKSSGLPSDSVLSLHEDANGTLWAGTDNGVARLSGDRFVEVHPVGGSHYVIQSMTSGRGGVLWLADSERGLARLRDGSIEKWRAEGMPSDGIYRLGSSRNGDLWVGYFKKGIAVIRGDSVETYTTETGLASGIVQAIYEDSAGSMWIGTREGLSRVRNGRWTTWTAKQKVPSGGIQAMTEDGCGHFWLVTPAGMLLLQLEDLERTPDGAPASLSFSTYGPDDGIRMADIPGTANPRIARSADGRLWISTVDGVATINPASIRINTVPPPISIEQLTIDGKPMDVTAPGIRFRGRGVQIDYTALSLTSPEAVRFRYQLEGLDQDWVEAGTRRQIVYANLSPGNYRFHVIASNNDGVWNQEGAVLSFRCEPYFYQTRLFGALCLCVLGLSVYGIVRMRIGQIRSRFQLVLAERTRLTREMHDTLLQGFAGVVYQLEAASRQSTTAPDLSKRRVERALEQADQSLREAREALSSMRLSALENSTLSEALLATGKQILEGTPIRFDMDLNGRVRQLPYDIQANLYIIAREAINNALNHAKPQSVNLELAYSRDSVRLIVEDDGVGFDPDNTPIREDHWGLGGMRERARLIGARLTIHSERGLGTRITVMVDRAASKSRG